MRIYLILIYFEENNMSRSTNHTMMMTMITVYQVLSNIYLHNYLIFTNMIIVIFCGYEY